MAVHADDIADAQAEADLAVAQLITALAKAVQAEIPKGLQMTSIQAGSLALSRIMAAQVGVVPTDEDDR